MKQLEVFGHDIPTHSYRVRFAPYSHHQGTKQT